MKLITQLSAFPDEKPNSILVEKAPVKYVSLKREMEKNIKKLGPYSFAKKAQECLIKSDTYSQSEHGLTSKEVYTLADNVFQDYVNWVLDISTFLKNIKEIPGYEIPTIKKGK